MHAWQYHTNCRYRIQWWRGWHGWSRGWGDHEELEEVEEPYDVEGWGGEEAVVEADAMPADNAELVFGGDDASGERLMACEKMTLLSLSLSCMGRGVGAVVGGIACNGIGTTCKRRGAGATWGRHHQHRLWMKQFTWEMLHVEWPCPPSIIPHRDATNISIMLSQWHCHI